MRFQKLALCFHQLGPVALVQLWVCLAFTTPAFSQNFPISGELSDGGIYRILFPGKPLEKSLKSEVFNKIVTTTYHWTDETREVFFYIGDDGEHQQLNRDDKVIRESYLNIFLSYHNLEFSPAFLNESFSEFTYRENTPFAIKGLSMKVHELKSDRKGSIYSIYTGNASYGLVILGMNEQEAMLYVESLELAPYPPNDISLQQDLSKKISILLEGTVPYKPPPYPKRSLAPQTGGWGYIHAPPEKAKPPGTIPELDPLFEQCTEEAATACDDLVQSAYLYTDDLRYAAAPYLNYGRTCGGRTLNQYCRTLLHGEEVAPGTDITPLWQFSQYRLRNEQLDLKTIPPPNSAPPQTRSAALDLLWLECGINAQPESCDELDKETGFVDLSLHRGGPYSAFAQSCGGRTSLIAQDCHTLLRPGAASIEHAEPTLVSSPELDSLMAQCRSSNGKPCYQLHRKARMALITTKTKHSELQYQHYINFGKTCGGVVDRPVTRHYCGDFSTWPTVGQ